MQSLLSLQWDIYPPYFNSIRPPFYPIFLMPFVALSKAVWPIQLAQSFMGVFQAFVLAHIAGRWRGRRAGNRFPFVDVAFIVLTASLLGSRVFRIREWWGRLARPKNYGLRSVRTE